MTATVKADESRTLEDPAVDRSSVLKNSDVPTASTETVQVESNNNAIGIQPAISEVTDFDATKASPEEIQAETERLMVAARVKLEHILDAGELLEMDRRLKKLFKDGKFDLPMLACISANIENSEPGSSKHQCLTHLYTVAQEELEKTADPAKGLLHRLCRQSNAQIRDNILRDSLAPQTEIFLPDATRIPLDPPTPPKVSHSEFSAAVAESVTQLRGLDADGDLIRASIEEVRTVAKEARLVLVDTAPESDVRDFEQSLMETWPLGTTGA